MIEQGMLPLPIIDACALDERFREALKPGQVLLDRTGNAHRLPRYFYEVGSWQTAREVQVTEHFVLSEFLEVDVREQSALIPFPRFVPLAVTLLAAHLELLRQAAGTFVHVAANGGYRSPSHALTDYASPHCWGLAANIYKIGDEYLDTQDRIERYAQLVKRVTPAVWIRPYGFEAGFADDHLHVDLGYARLTPRGHDEEEEQDRLA